MSEILVVTPNLYAVAEPAALAGFPTMFIKRPRSRCLALTIPTFSPTFIADGMNQVLQILRSAVPPEDPENPTNYPPFRIRVVIKSHPCSAWVLIVCLVAMYVFHSFFIYQFCLAGWVWGGIQVVTGHEVAIKFELIKEAKPSGLLHEAVVQL